MPKKRRPEYKKKQWKSQYTKLERQEFAKTNPLAWIFEYEPKIRVPGTGEIPFEPYWAQQQLLLDNAQFRALNKARQMGYTTSFGVETAHSMIYTPSAEIVVLSKSEKEAKKFLDKFYVAYKSVEGKDPHYSPLVVENTFNAKAENGNTIDVLTSSRGAGRSYSATDLYFDEMMHTLYADDIYQASLPTVSVTGGRVTLFTTPKGRAGVFPEIFRSPEQFDFSTHQYEWWFSPVYNPYYEEFLDAWLKFDKKRASELVEKARDGEWYKKMRRRYNRVQWLQEYECSFDADYETVFSARQLKDNFRKNWLPEVEDGIAEVAYSEEVIDGHEYFTGVDLGRKTDATVIVTFDITEIPAKVVEYKRIPPATAQWDLIVLSIQQTHDKFNSEMVHDATGTGDPISAQLQDISEEFIITGGGSSRAKYNVIENLRTALDNGVIQLPRIKQLVREFEDYKWNDKGLVTDSVLAVALAVHGFYEPETVWAGADDFNYVGGAK